MSTFHLATYLFNFFSYRANRIESLADNVSVRTSAIAIAGNEKQKRLKINNLIFITVFSNSKQQVAAMLCTISTIINHSVFVDFFFQ